MAEYSVSDYGIFNTGISTITKLNENLKTYQSTMTDCKNKITSDSVFVGPICDSISDGLVTVDNKVTTLVDNFTKIASYLSETATTYNSSDAVAQGKILKSTDGVLSTETYSIATGNTTQDKIFNYLASQGFNNAAICGIMANIQHESNFSTTALGDNGTSYGLCQWHNSRWDGLKNYCSNNNLDSSSLEGQLQYLVYELKNHYQGVYNTLMNVSNTSQGAYEAAYKWTVSYEIPANKEAAGERRGNSAQSTYWDTYGVKV